MRPQMLPQIGRVCCALGVALMLAACSGDTKYRTIASGDPAAAARADAAEMALEELRASLAAAQGALAPATTAEQRVEARKAVVAAREDLAEVREMLAAEPASDARDAADAALEAVGIALERTAEALGATDPVASAGGLQLASMHTSLERAQAALDAAQMRLGEALEASPSPALRSLLVQAQGTLTTAQVSLVPLLRAELAARARAGAAEAELDRLTLAFGEDLAEVGPEAARLVAAADASVTLSARRQGVEWSANVGFVDTSREWTGGNVLYTIVDYGSPNPERLAIVREAVPYEAGSAMPIPGDAGVLAMNEFPGRGEVFRALGYNHREFQLPRQGSFGPSTDDPVIQPADIPGIPYGRNGLRQNLRGHAISSFQYRAEGGLTMKFGGLPPDQRPEGAPAGSEGSLIYGDLEALTAKGTYDCGAGSEACDEAATRDLTVAFGAPSRDPSGEPAYYWTVNVPNPKLTLAAGTTARLDASARAAPDGIVGHYEMLLSNHGGVSAAGVSKGDRYLRYAAYGLFQFIDSQISRVGRIQTVHYGFDAFGDHNPLPAATADSIAATLNGRTMAWLATTPGSGMIDELNRMRGHVTLHACIGGSGCQASDFHRVPGASGTAPPTDANKLTGAIHDLELRIAGGAWSIGETATHPEGTHAFAGDILLDGAIGADGAFAGDAIPDDALSDSQRSAANGATVLSNGQRRRGDGADSYGYTIREQEGGNGDLTMDDYWQRGGFEGVFYGPVEALEAAGTWWLPSTAHGLGMEVLGMVGSFGVIVCREGDGDC